MSNFTGMYQDFSEKIGIFYAQKFFEYFGALFSLNLNFKRPDSQEEILINQ